MIVWNPNISMLFRIVFQFYCQNLITVVFVTRLERLGEGVLERVCVILCVKKGK